MSATRYGISWLYGEFRIARYHRDRIEAQWESPELVETHADLIRALDTAAEHMDMKARGDVTIVHEHDLHTHDYLQVSAFHPVAISPGDPCGLAIGTLIKNRLKLLSATSTRIEVETPENAFYFINGVQYLFASELPSEDDE